MPHLPQNTFLLFLMQFLNCLEWFLFPVPLTALCVLFPNCTGIFLQRVARVKWGKSGQAYNEVKQRQEPGSSGIRVEDPSRQQLGRKTAEVTEWQLFSRVTLVKRETPTGLQPAHNKNLMRWRYVSASITQSIPPATQSWAVGFASPELLRIAMAMVTLDTYQWKVYFCEAYKKTKLRLLLFGTVGRSQPV